MLEESLLKSIDLTTFPAKILSDFLFFCLFACLLFCTMAERLEAESKCAYVQRSRD